MIARGAADVQILWGESRPFTGHRFGVGKSLEQ